LQRLYWIPEGNPATDGAYLAYPFRELLEGVVEESWISRTIVIGEDLGTVPPGFTDTMVRAGLLSYQVFYFTEQDGVWMPPQAYRREALVCGSTHDLPTLKGWWIGNDIDWRLKANRVTEREAAMQRQERMRDRQLLIDALVEAQALAPNAVQADSGEITDEDLVAIHRFLARTPCRLFSVQIDDALGALEQANLPGTIDEHPNWRRKIAAPIETLGEKPLFRAVTGAVAAERPGR
jgi:4-alpha-glucanotransferase